MSIVPWRYPIFGISVLGHSWPADPLVTMNHGKDPEKSRTPGTIIEYLRIIGAQGPVELSCSGTSVPSVGHGGAGVYPGWYGTGRDYGGSALIR